MGGVERISRRSFLRVSGVSATAALLSACGVSSAPTQPAAAPTAPTQGSSAAPKRGGELLVAEQNDTQTFDPHRTTGGSPAYGMVYNTLVRWDPQPDGSFKAAPNLATSWTLDAATATFKLRPNVKFHDGSDWTAEVAKWNLERMKDAKSQARAFVSGITSIDVLDPLTLRLNLVAPLGSLLSNLSQAADGRPYMISKAMAEKAGDNYGTSPATTAGTGPMRLVDWVQGNVHTVQRTGSYWQMGADGQALPYYDSLKVRFIADDSVRLTELRSGNVHIIDNIQSKDVATASKEPSLDIVENPNQVSCYQFTFSTKSQKFADVKLRQAVHYALDRETLAKVLGQGLGEPEYWFLTRGYLGYDESLPHYSFDKAKAKQLVTDAGYPSGVDVGLLIINRSVDQQEAQIVKQMLGDVGINANIEVLERLAWLARVQTLDFDMGLYFTGLRPDPDSILAGRFQTGEGKNQAGMSDPVMDDLLAQGRGSLDDGVRAAAYAKVQQRIYETAWYGTMWMKKYFDGYNKKVVGRGLVQQGGFDLQPLWLQS